MGKASRDKGQRAEREIVNLHREAGVRAERVPLSGAVAYQGNKGDVDLYVFGTGTAPLVCEVKARSGEMSGFGLVRRYLGDHDALFIREDRQELLVVLPCRTWLRLLNQMVKP